LSGLLFLVLIYLISPRTVNPYKTYFIISFIIICLLGIWAAINPGHCLRILNIQTVKKKECNERKLQIIGHHPDCGEFSGHIFTYKNMKYCVGCTGLLTGGFLAVITCILYLIYGSMEIIFWAGFIMVLFSQLELTVFNYEFKLVKFLSNMGLVWGSALILTGLLDYGNIFLGIYFLFLIVAWIFTRTMISEKNHYLICKNCLSVQKNLKKDKGDY